MKTFDQIKSNFRVVEIGDNFYIQEKNFLGWSYDTNAYLSYSNEYPKIIIITGYTFLISLGLFLISLIISIFIKQIPIITYISLVTFLISFTLHISLHFILKSIAICCYNLKEAENNIDNIVNQKLKEIKEKERLKVKKYHYFYTTAQLRKEKLKKLK